MNLRHAVSFVITATVFAVGCSTQSSDPVLATVGDEKITLADYRRAYQVLGEKPDISDPEKRRAFLQDLINKQLLEKEAYRIMPEMDDGMRRRLHRFAEGQLLSLLQKKEVSDKVKVTDAEVKAVWDHMDREVKARHILVRSEAEIRQIAGELKGGKPFEDLAREKSFDTATGEKGGDLGWVSAGQMIEPFDVALFKLQKGQISEPVHSVFGWHIIKAEDIRPAERPDFAAVKEKIRLTILQQRMTAEQQAFEKALNDRAKPENQYQALDLIDKKFAFELPPEKLNDPYAQFSVNRDIPSFTTEELAVPVVKFADRPPFTVKDFNEALGWMPAGVWPKGAGTDEVEELVRRMMKDKLQKERAMELGVNKDPEYVAIVKKKEKEMRVNQLYYNGIVAKVQLSPTDLRDYFEKNRDHYKILERTVQARIETADSTVAARAAALWKSGKKFEEVEQTVKTADPAAVTMARSLETPRGAEPPLDELIYAGKVGDVVGPVHLVGLKDQSGMSLPERWVVAQALEMEPERYMTFEEAEKYVADHAKTEAAENALNKLLGELKQKFTVTVNEKALDAITPESLAEPAAGTTT